jgi:hypothetical protein
MVSDVTFFCYYFGKKQSCYGVIDTQGKRQGQPRRNFDVFLHFLYISVCLDVGVVSFIINTKKIFYNLKSYVEVLI